MIPIECRHIGIFVMKILPMYTDLKQFGARVRELRLAAGMSQEEFAAHCGLHRTYVGGIERGERNVGLVNVIKLATTLGVPVAELFPTPPTPPPPIAGSKLAFRRGLK